MAGLSKKEQQWRMEGFAWAVEMANKAKDKGEDPLAVLNKELALRNRTGVFIFKNMRDLFVEDTTYKVVLSGTMKAVALMCLWEVFDFGLTRMERFEECYHRYVNSIFNGTTEWAAVFELLESKGIQIDLSDEIRQALEASTDGTK